MHPSTLWSVIAVTPFEFVDAVDQEDVRTFVEVHMFEDVSLGLIALLYVCRFPLLHSSSLGTVYEPLTFPGAKLSPKSLKVSTIFSS